VRHVASVAAASLCLAGVSSAAAPSPPPVELARGRLPRALAGRVPTTLPTRKRVVALTFDAGGDDAGLPRIVATLRRQRVPATFFMTGHFARFYPAWARRIAAAYPIGNHTMYHLDLTHLSDASVRSEVLEAQRAIHGVTGHDPEPLFRFPYGYWSARALRIVNSLGYAAVGWTADTAGWLGPSGGQSRTSVIRRALAAVKPGAMILMHVGSNPYDHSTLDAYALAAIIVAIERRGYSFTTLPQAYAAAYPKWVAASTAPAATRSPTTFANRTTTATVAAGPTPKRGASSPISVASRAPRPLGANGTTKPTSHASA
jgi:peptidoglycan/xylan/chitin deacetylase (PgdA/CDA1 family)